MGQWQECFLKSDGKFVTIRVSNNGLELYIKDVQGGNRKAPKVWICTRANEERNQLAFCVKHESNWYIAKVEGQILQLEKTGDKSEPLSESCWFQTVNNGRGPHYMLQSVNKPTLYLSILGKRLSVVEFGDTAHFSYEVVQNHNFRRLR